MGKKANMLNQRVPGIDIEMRRTPLRLTERSLVAAHKSTELELKKLQR